MRIFAFQGKSKGTFPSINHVKPMLEAIAQGSNTDDLVVALYFGVPGLGCRGTAYIRDWHTPETWQAVRGHWRLTQHFPTPEDLPARYRLIRIHLDKPASAYPREERDIYGWRFRYPSWEHHLALIFAHELHHFRRHHLGLHPREGEHGANRWALHRIQALGWDVLGEKPEPQSKKPIKKRRLWDPHKPFRTLRPGQRVQILSDPNGRYQSGIAEVVRPLRSNAKRLVIQTHDGKVWRWPVNWLKPISE